MIVKRGEKYYVVSKSGNKDLGGPYDTEAEAQKRLGEIEFFKHADGLDVVFRTDAGTMGTVQMTPQGGMRVGAFLTRSGVFSYKTADGRTVREWRPPEEVFRGDSLQTLLDAPVTDLHPPVLVTTGNFRAYARGNVSGQARQDGDKIAAELVINDASLVAAIESRSRREISCGYKCRVDNTPGTTPNGEAYDRVQRDIFYNHVAIVPKGRAGSDVSLRLDGAGNEIPATGEETGNPPHRRNSMLTIRIDGVDYPMETEADRKAVQLAMGRFQTKLDTENTARATERAAADTLRARADTAEAKVTELTAKLTEAQDPARMDAAVATRGDLVAKARLVLGKDYEPKGKTDSQIRVDALVKVYPGEKAKIEGETEDYRRARFDSLDQKVTADPDGLRDLRVAGAGPKVRTDAPEVDPTDPVAAKKRNDSAGTEAWRQPLLVSRDTAAE